MARIQRPVFLGGEGNGIFRFLWVKGFREILRQC
jgi:hypothetical protein